MGREIAFDFRLRQRIRAERERRDWSQAALALKLKSKGINGVLASTVAKIESGERKVKVDEIAALADLFGTSVDSLLGRKSGVANEIADIVSQLQHAAGRAVTDIAGIAGQLQSLFIELGEIEFDGYRQLQESGGRALRALTEAQDALYDVGQVEAPQRVVHSRIEQLIERKADEKAEAMMWAKLKSLAEEMGEKDDEA